MDRKYFIDLSYGQHTEFGKCVGHMYYSNRAMRDMAPGCSGYPHNGGEHTFCISGGYDECEAFVQMFAEHYGDKVKRECEHVLAEFASIKHANAILSPGIKLRNIMREICVDLSTGRPTMFGSNVEHMYDIFPNLKAKAPGCIGYPDKTHGSLLLRGTVRELVNFFKEFLKAYPDQETADVCLKIITAIRGHTKGIIRTYRLMFAEDYAEPFPRGEAYAKAHQVVNHRERFSFGHMGSERDQFIRYAAWEVAKVYFDEIGLHLIYVNGFEWSIPYLEFWSIEDAALVMRYGPDRATQSALHRYEDKYEEILRDFRVQIAQDPRLKDTQADG